MGPRSGPGSFSPRPGGPGGAGGPGAPDRTLYVGNLPYDCTQQEVETLINGVAEGQVVRVHLPTDPDGRKRGFGFVTMASAETAKSASEALEGGADIRGRKLVVNLAHPKGERPARSDGPGFGGGYAGGGGFAGGGPGAEGFLLGIRRVRLRRDARSTSASASPAAAVATTARPRSREKSAAAPTTGATRTATTIEERP